MHMIPTNRPPRKLFAFGRIAPKGTTGDVTHLAARIGGAGLRITSTMIPQVDAGAFVVEMERAAEKLEMQRALQEAA